LFRGSVTLGSGGWILHLGSRNKANILKNLKFIIRCNHHFENENNVGRLEMLFVICGWKWSGDILARIKVLL